MDISMHLNRLIILFAAICLGLVTPLTSSWALNDPAVVQEHLTAAERYMTQEQWDYASYEFRAVLKESPKNVPAIVGLAKALVKSGYKQDALRHLQDHEKQIKHIDLDLAFAETYQAMGKSVNAFNRYEKALRVDPFNEAAFSGCLATVKALPEKQQKTYNQKLKNLAATMTKRADKAIGERYFHAASRYLGIAAIYYKKPEVINDYGVALILDGQYQKAWEQFRKILSDFENWQAYANGAVADLSLNKTYAAKIKIEAALSLAETDKDKSMLYNTLGYIFEQSRQSMSAQTAYEKAVELNPFNVQALKNLAYIYQKDQQYPQALDTYKTLLRQNPKSAELKTKQGFVYELMNKFKPAVSAYKQAIQLDSDYKPAYENLSVLYRKMGKDDAAADTYKRMMEIQFAKIENSSLKDKTSGPKEKVSAKVADYVDLFLLNNSKSAAKPTAAATHPAQSSTQKATQTPHQNTAKRRQPQQDSSATQSVEVSKTATEKTPPANAKVHSEQAKPSVITEVKTTLKSVKSDVKPEQQPAVTPSASPNSQPVSDTEPSTKAPVITTPETVPQSPASHNTTRETKASKQSDAQPFDVLAPITQMSTRYPSTLAVPNQP